MSTIKELFSKNYKTLSQKRISDLTGSSTPVESSDYIEAFIEQKTRNLPAVDFATASNFAKFGSAQEYAFDSIKRVYNTYPYDGSLAEKIDWLNRSTFYDLYVFNHKYPRTCGYAVFSPSGITAVTETYDTRWKKSTTPEYVQVKGGPHADPDASTKTLAKQFPIPYDGNANIWDNTTGINRKSNLLVDPSSGVTVEFWIKKSAYYASETGYYESVFDLWNGEDGTTDGDNYGRFSVWLTNQAITAPAAKFNIHWASGSAFVNWEDLSVTTLVDDNWHHVAITCYSGSTGAEANIFIDGQHDTIDATPSNNLGTVGEITGSLIANIGSTRLPALTQAKAATAVAAGKTVGYSQLSASMDEFRFWKRARTPQQISRFWFTQIGGGTNTDNSKFSGSSQPVDLGVYYKFNEGNTGTNSTDSTVLDYSGRISNGTWNGFISGSSRVAGETSSAMIESSASLSEFKDPIIYSSHPDVVDVLSELSSSGREHDLRNNMSIYHTIPEWITSEDQDIGGEQLKKLTQIIASYLDTMYLQIESIPRIGDKEYPGEEVIFHNPDERLKSKTRVKKFSRKPVTYAKNMVEDHGLIAPEIFASVSELAQLADRDEYREFDQKLYDIKNTIYQNIYNNLTYIYKSKGTEKGLRNLIRCYGVDDELIKINLYTDGTTYRFDDSDYRPTAVKSNYIDFNHTDRNLSTIYQSASVDISNSISYIPGWNPSQSVAGATGSGHTFEVDVIFPLKFDVTHPANLHYDYNHLTSSIFGCHTDSATLAEGDFAWVADETDVASFQIYAIRPEQDSKDVKFMLTSSYTQIPTLTSDLYTDVYDNERWLFAVKVYPQSNFLEGRHISGSAAELIRGSWTIELQGYNANSDQLDNKFSVSGTMTPAVGTKFMNSNKRIYAGAHRNDFSGSIVYYTDVKIGACRVWDDYLTDDELKTHALDPSNFGRERIYKSSYLFNQAGDPNVDAEIIPQFETLLLNWDFSQVTGSSNGIIYTDHYGGSSYNSSFEVLDASSGSDGKWEVPARYKYHYTGRGDYFLPNTTSSVDLNFLSAVKVNMPEVMSGEDTISILDTDDNYFTRDSKPINHYFAIEKSMYQAMSDRMLNMFATVTEFNNIIGEPVNRYRQEYKALGKVREAFFRKVTNEPDFNKFVDFYKWIDNSLTVMLMQMIPATANFSDGIKTMVESHILERNKYWTKFPTLEFKPTDPTGFVKGIKELTYNWKFGHAPLNPAATVNEDQNCLWWRERSEASASYTAGNQVDTDRNTIRRIGTSDVTTDKIILTGEYTSPTSYPNAALPNAAQFNFAQSGDDFSGRTQYKGSTYALRRFTKPYKLDVDADYQIHGGVNYIPNKRKSLAITDLRQKGADTTSLGFFNTSTAAAPIQSIKDCEDVLDPVEKKQHYEFDYTDEDSVVRDGRMHAPYNLVSSSMTSESEGDQQAEAGIIAVNLHTDTYGDSNETPMQGPFTEKNVGGMAHRHYNVNQGSDGENNRSELFRITKPGGAFRVVPGRYTSNNTVSVVPHFDQFYRDEYAKRPVNIRNIEMTGSDALGNYQKNYQVVSTVGGDAQRLWFRNNVDSMTTSNPMTTPGAYGKSSDFAVFDFQSNTSAAFNGDTVTLVTADGVTTEFLFTTTSGDGSTGDVVTGGKILVQINGMSNRNDFAEELKLAMEGLNARLRAKIEVTRTDGVLTLKQVNAIGGTAAHPGSPGDHVRQEPVNHTTGTFRLLDRSYLSGTIQNKDCH